jgi:hypothetical protein
LLNVSIAVECDPQHFVPQQRKHIEARLQMKRRLREHGLTGQQRLSNLFRDVARPLVVPIVPPSKSDDKAGVSDTLHERENPFREETSTGPPVIAPA